MNMGFLRKASVPGMPGLRIRSRLSWIAGRLRNRPDSEHELTVKRLFTQGLLVQLRLANARYPNITVTPDQELLIWGVVTGSVRQFHR